MKEEEYEVHLLPNTTHDATDYQEPREIERRGGGVRLNSIFEFRQFGSNGWLGTRGTMQPIGRTRVKASEIKPNRLGVCQVRY